jgi:carboxypeptidase C (cathepsin A)|tara:strand:- start:23638 stop:24816 length:1179 start_codon:yes stop_codon:yes gene_type:complete
LKRRKYAWNDAGRLLYVDSPVNTGFSYSSSRRDAAKDETTVANDLLEFLYAFMLSRPMLVDAPVYVTGESYAGHYVPAFARAIFDANARDDGPVRINLQGLAIGNGLTDPAIQYAAYADYSLGNDIVSAATVKQTAKKLPSCVEKIKSCASGKTSSKENRAECLDAVDSCQAIPEALLEDAAERNGGKAINVYDIRKSCDAELCYDFSAAEAFLNRKDVQEAFGVSKKWEMCDASVHQDMMGDWMHDYEILIPDMIEAGIRVMIYAGEDDFICNWLGNLRWVKAMQWNGREAFNAARPEPFIIQGAGDGEDDVVGGDVREHGGLSFVKISEAGHMVPMDQPRNALTMIQRFVNNEPIARGRGGDEPKLSAAPRRFGPVEDDVVGRLAVATQK